MKTTNLSLLALSACILIACGGSGSDAVTQNGNVDKPHQPTTPPATASFIGTKAQASISGSAKSHSARHTTSNLNQIIIDGKTIVLTPAGISAGGFFSTDTGINGDDFQRIVSGTNYQYSRFGFLFKTDKNPDTVTLFSQGKLTTDMPDTGSANYAGDYVEHDFKQQAVRTGTLTAKADFGQRSLSVFADVDKGKASFKARIAGSSFATADGAGKGHFYGPQAAELGGTYLDNGAIIAFGAKKQ